VAKAEAVIVDAGGRELRVSNPGRVIFPATDSTAEVTKFEIVEGRPPRHRALHA
jgi:hypothetical protein